MDASPFDDPRQATNSMRAPINAARKSITVKAPVGRVYQQWARVEELPKFITRLQNVRRIDNTRFSYTWIGGGSDDSQGFFQIVLQIPGRRIAWRTLSNGFMSGVVSFEPHSEQETEVTLKIRSIFNPPSLSRRVEEYLSNFKRLVESEEGTRHER